MIISKLIEQLNICKDSYGDVEVQIADWYACYKNPAPVVKVDETYDNGKVIAVVLDA